MLYAGRGWAWTLFGTALMLIGCTRDASTLADVEVSAEHLVLPDAWVGHPVEGQVTFTNAGSRAVVVDSVEVTGDDFRLGSPPPTRLPAESRAQLVVWFGPRAPGAAEGVLRLTGADGAIEVQLRGTARAVPQCIDQNTCTEDRFDPGTGACVHEPVAGSCDDHSYCTLGDACSEGSCVGQPVPCDDGSPCTTDACHPESGCGHVALPDGSSCGQDATFACLQQASCERGQCTGAPGACAWVQVAAGAAHTVAIRSDGTLWAWGDNSSGQLGDGTAYGAIVPQQVVSAGAEWREVAGPALLRQDGSLWRAGPSGRPEQVGHERDWKALGARGLLAIREDGSLWQVGGARVSQVGEETDWKFATYGSEHWLAIKADGSLWGWGTNRRGELWRPPDSRPVTVPVRLGTKTDWMSVSIGSDHSVALKMDGTLWTWRNATSTLDDYVPLEGSPAVQIGTDAGWVQAVAGEYHSVALRSDGTVWTWGSNGHGQIGNGYAGSRRTNPYQVMLPKPAVAVAAGGNATVALLDDGLLLAWGENRYGQLGNGSLEDRLIPTPVHGPGSWAQVHLGSTGAVGLKSDGTVWHWGTKPDSRTPTVPRWEAVQIGTAHDWAEVHAGLRHTVALRENGTIWTWGANLPRALGNTEAWVNPVPKQVQEGRLWASSDAGTYHTIAVAKDGTLWAWGTTGAPSDPPHSNQWMPHQVGTDSDWLQASGGSQSSLLLKTDGSLWRWPGLEDGAPTDSPQRIGNTADWALVSAGASHALALKQDGTIWSWGANDVGQLGDGTETPHAEPRRVGTDGDWVQVAAGLRVSLALKADGSLWVWGGLRDTAPEGAASHQLTPVRIGGESRWVQAAVGGHIVALEEDGNLVAWGPNEHGQLGTPTTPDRHTPVQVGRDLDWKEAAAGYGHTLAVKQDGRLYAWGWNGYGQLGTGTTASESVPVLIDADRTWRRVVAAGGHSLALTADGALFAWGRNDYGQLGDGSRMDRIRPVLVGEGRRWRQVSTGARHTVAVDTDGGLWVWGDTGAAAVGEALRPTRFGEDRDWAAASAGGGHTMALAEDGTLWAWGDNASGQLGDGTTEPRPDAVEVLPSGGWAWVAAGANHTAAGRSDGTLWTWGAGRGGRLGDNTTARRPTPRPVGTDTEWLRAAAADHTAALKRDGHLWTWGANGTGQLGDGTTQDALSPLQVTAAPDWAQVATGTAHTVGVKKDGSLWTWGNDFYGQLGLEAALPDASTP